MVQLSIGTAFEVTNQEQKVSQFGKKIRAGKPQDITGPIFASASQHSLQAATCVQSLDIGKKWLDSLFLLSRELI